LAAKASALMSYKQQHLQQQQAQNVNANQPRKVTNKIVIQIKLNN
jgi:hypothetical protein